VPAPRGRATVLLAVTAIATDDVWAVGRSAGKSTTYHWDGTSWSSVAAPSPGRKFNELAAVSAVGPDDVWATGTFVNRHWHVLALHWNGRSWKRVDAPAPPRTSGTDSLGVVAFEDGTAWMAGFSERPLDRPTVPMGQHSARTAPGDVSIRVDKTMAERWDGVRWRSVAPVDPLRSGNLLDGVDGVTADDVWAVGFWAHGKLHNLAEHWDGSAWSVVPVPDVPSVSGNDLRAASAISATDVWAVGEVLDGPDNKGLIQHWDGHRWHASTITP
jgi:hypothetical protein